MKNYLGSLPVIFIGFIIIYLLNFTGCGGIVEIYSSLFLLIIGLSYLTIYYLIQIINSIRKKSIKINVLPLFSALIIVGIGFLIQHLKQINQPNVNLRSYREFSNSNSANINLLDNGEIEIFYGHYEEKCSYYGTYELKGDTLIISNLDLTNNIKIPKRFLITDDHLLPINDGRIESDSTLYYSITERTAL
ncbi:hypothetical protein [Fulvivirga sp.]|uniref:hypothetical protein n=1 Tax=Fulvivirga sp. TaxID=1931237 RepID=UPI0032EDD35D